MPVSPAILGFWGVRLASNSLSYIGKTPPNLGLRGFASLLTYKMLFEGIVFCDIEIDGPTSCHTGYMCLFVP